MSIFKILCLRSGSGEEIQQNFGRRRMEKLCGFLRRDERSHVLQTSRVCCREKDFPPSPPSILHILFFIYLYRLLQLLYGVCYFYLSLCDGEFYGSSFFYTEASKVSSILVSRSRKPFCVLLCFILWTRLWVVSCAHVYWWSKLRLAHCWETNN